MLLRKNRTIYQYLTNSSISIRRIEDSQALEKQHTPAALLEKKTKNPFDAQKRYHFRIPERENLTVQHKMTETPIDLTSKKKTSLWSCFQVCFPVIPQRPPASSSKSQKFVSKITTSSSAADKIDLRELETCLDNEKAQKQELPIPPRNTADEPSSLSATKNHSTLTEFWRYIITFCFMGFMSCFQANNRRSITSSAESTEQQVGEPKDACSEPKVVAAAS